MKKVLDNQKIITYILAIIFAIIAFFGVAKTAHGVGFGVDPNDTDYPVGFGVNPDNNTEIGVGEYVNTEPTPDATQQMINMTGGTGNTGGAGGSGGSGGPESVQSICASVGANAPADAIALTKAIQESGVSGVWKWILSLIDYLIAAMLIFIAIVNILQIQIDTYAVRKALPNLIIGVILANLSWFFCLALVDLSTAIVKWENIQTGGSVLATLYDVLFGQFMKQNLGIDVLATVLVVGAGLLTGFLGFLVGIIVFLIPIALFLIIWFLLFARVYVVEFLVAVSPIFFFAIGFPLTTIYFQQWWDWFWKWVFMAPLIFFLWVFAIKIGESLNGQIIKYVMVCLVLYFSFRLPFMLGGAIMGAWGNVGKFAAGLGWKGYGSAMGKLSTFDTEGGKARWIGKAAKATNLYGAGTALKERFELGEKKRMDAFTSGTTYKDIAGREASIRYKMKEFSDSVLAMQNEPAVERRLQKYGGKQLVMDYMNGKGKGKSKRKAMTPDEKEDFLNKILIGPPAMLEEESRKAGLNEDQTALFRLLMPKKAQLERSRYFRGKGKNLLETLESTPMGAAGAAAGTAEAETDAEGAAPPPPNPQQFSESAKNIHGEITSAINAAKQGGAAGGHGIQTVQLSAKTEAEIEKINSYLAKMSSKDTVSHQDSFGEIKSAYHAAVGQGLSGPLMEKLAQANEQVDSHQSMAGIHTSMFNNPMLKDAADSYHMAIKGKIIGIEGINSFKDLTNEKLRENSSIIKTHIQPLFTDDGKIKPEIAKFTDNEINKINSEIKNTVGNLKTNGIELNGPDFTFNQKGKINQEITSQINTQVQSSGGISDDVKQKINNERMNLEKQLTKLNQLQSAKSNLESLEGQHGSIISEINKSISTEKGRI